MSLSHPLPMKTVIGYMRDLKSLVGKGDWPGPHSKDYADLLCEDVMQAFDPEKLDEGQHSYSTYAQKLLEWMGKLKQVIPSGIWQEGRHSTHARDLCELVLLMLRVHFIHGHVDVDSVAEPEWVLVSAPAEPAVRPVSNLAKIQRASSEKIPKQTTVSKKRQREDQM